jgi:hypothetical protein
VPRPDRLLQCGSQGGSLSDSDTGYQPQPVLASSRLSLTTPSCRIVNTIVRCAGQDTRLRRPRGNSVANGSPLCGQNRPVRQRRSEPFYQANFQHAGNSYDELMGRSFDPKIFIALDFSRNSRFAFSSGTMRVTTETFNGKASSSHYRYAYLSDGDGTGALHRLHHRELHRIGNEGPGRQSQGLDPLPIAATPRGAQLPNHYRAVNGQNRVGPS